MPPKRRTTTAPKGDEHEEAAPKDDADAKLTALVEELDVEVESRCQTLESDAQRMVSWIRSQYQMQLQKLTKKVRGTKISELFAGLPGDIDLELGELKALADKHKGAGGEAAAEEHEELVPRTPLRVISNANGSQTVLRTTRAASKTSNITGTARKRAAPEPTVDVDAPRTTRRAAKASGIMQQGGGSAVPQTPMTFHKDLPFTPAVGSRPGGVMNTVMRLPRRGESIMNARGSPVGTFDRDASAQLIMDESNKINYMAVEVGNDEVNIADSEAVARMPKEARLKAAQNVLAMQAQLEAMLATLQT
uniref:Borealin N-terminal domain-containing protein n=1 Tax=Hemiselmis andersenii TaxID=464988 RepID=A0A6U2H2B3_HEMAN